MTPRANGEGFAIEAARPANFDRPRAPRVSRAVATTTADDAAQVRLRPHALCRATRRRNRKILSRVSEG
jgi:hypothetical protein